MKNIIKSATVTTLFVLGISSSTLTLADEVTDPDLVRQAQELLYNLNYDIGEVDGQLSEKTRGAILKYQQNVEIKETGSLTVELLLGLRDVKAPDKWGAISAGLDGGWGASWNYGKRRDAEDEASKNCKDNSKVECGVLAVHSSNCMAAYHWNSEKRWGWRMRSGTSIDKAKLNALGDCHKHREDDAKCNLMTAICADGRHVSE